MEAKACGSGPTYAAQRSALWPKRCFSLGRVSHGASRTLSDITPLTCTKPVDPARPNGQMRTSLQTSLQTSWQAGKLASWQARAQRTFSMRCALPQLARTSLDRRLVCGRRRIGR